MSMNRDDLLKAVMARLMGGDNGDNSDIQLVDLTGEDAHDEHSEEIDCGVEGELSSLQALLGAMPTEGSPDIYFIKWGLKKIDDAAKGIYKEARLAELQEEIQMLTKPDDFDLMSEEHKHIRLHIEERSMRIEARKRDAVIYRRFHDLVKKALLPNKG